MVQFDDNLIIQILDFLGEIYPKRVLKEDQILPDLEKRDELKKHIAYCCEKGWIEIEGTTWRNDGSPEYGKIKINVCGIDCLKNQSQ